MNWYKKYIFAQIRGEFWINDSGNAIYADGDIGDYNHEGYVLESVRGQYVEDVEFLDWDDTLKQKAKEQYKKEFRDGEIIDDDPHNLAFRYFQEEGMTEEEWEIANEGGDAREFAMKHWGWKRLEGTNIETYYLKNSDLEKIADGLYDAYQDDALNGYFNIYVYSTNKWYTDIPYVNIENKNLRGYESRR